MKIDSLSRLNKPATNSGRFVGGYIPSTLWSSFVLKSLTEGKSKTALIREALETLIDTSNDMPMVLTLLERLQSEWEKKKHQHGVTFSNFKHAVHTEMYDAGVETEHIDYVLMNLKE